MKFGLLTHLPWPEGTDACQVMENNIEEIQHGEQVGFYSAWLAEHHFSRYGLGASSLVVASAIAARTKSIRLGTAVLVPPLHNPLRLAEDTATLDVISNGRLDVGFGRGAARYEFVPYNVDPADTQERFQESINIIQKLWTEDDYSVDGDYYQVTTANLVPKPVQQPHPPVYIAATRTPATLEYAVSKGTPTMIGLTLDTAPALDLCKRYEAMSKEAGFNVTMGEIPFFRFVYVAETEEQVSEDIDTAMNWVIDMLQWRGTLSEGSEITQKLDDFRKSRTEQPPTIDYIRENRGVIGTPEQCVAKIKELQAQGIEYFGCNFAFGGMDHGKVMKSMELFAKEVMPHFA